MSMFETDTEVPVRGCGMRVKGGVYAETLMGPNGHPIECFIKDPPLPINPEEIGLTPVGVKTIIQGNQAYIFDWIGQGFYPNVSDFIEEARRFGASRRLPSTLDFSLLSPQSKLVCVHTKALTFHENYGDNSISERVMSPQGCPQIIKAMHDGIEATEHGPCARVWWTDHDSTDDDGEHLKPGELYTHRMPAFDYYARQRMSEPNSYQPGVFLMLPLHRIVVIRDPGTGSHEETASKINDQMGGKLPVELLDE